jgi:single-stranded-DNA-specific exonuclease
MAKTLSEPMAQPESSSEICLGVECSLLGRSWHEVTPAKTTVDDLQERFDIPFPVARILAARGFDIQSAQDFLNPTLKDLMPDPAVLAGMNEAVTRAVQAIENRESIVVFGDYDVDGATSSALLVLFFRALGVDAGSYIPDRVKEGYGPNEAALLLLRAQGASVVITVDCGITAFGPLSAASDAGLDVIVVDHHKAEADLPVASAVINPNRLDDTSGQGHLAAVGVTFLFVVAVNRALRESGWYGRNDVPEPDLRQWLDLVALGTVCDVVPLKGLNRAYVNAGLAVMSRGQNIGLAALANTARLKGVPRAFDLGYMLGPRVNAGGRVGDAALGTRLLTCEDADEAAILALRLNEHNANRKDIEAAVLAEAIEQAETASEEQTSLVFVIGEDWHPGVIGIVASRLRERYDLPACVVALDGGMAKGSGRSIPGVDLGRAILSARDAGLLFIGGGHAMAAGFSVEVDRLGAFKDFLTSAVISQVAAGGITPRYDVDATVSLEGAGIDLVHALSRLEPYGAGNEEPKVAVERARVAQADVVGNGHVRCTLTGESGGRLKAIAFNSADSELGYGLLGSQGRALHVVGSLREDNWQGRSNVQLVIEDAAWVT